MKDATGVTSTDLRLRDVLADIEKRRAMGQDPHPSDYNHLPPELCLEVERLFHGLARIDSLRRELVTDVSYSSPTPTDDRLRQAIQDLAPKALRVVFERDIQRHSWDEIAAMLGEAKESLRETHARAINDLLQRLKGTR